MKQGQKPLAMVVAGLVLGAILGASWSGLGSTCGAQADSPSPPTGIAPAKKPQRFGAVIGLRPEKKDYYVKLHAETWPSILKLIRDSNIRNYSIYLAELDGKLYLFAYYEYVGEDFEADMQKIAADPNMQRWWKETDPCQIRLTGTPEGKWWKPIPEVFHTD